VIGPLASGGVVLADATLTGGAYELFQVTLPAGEGPPMHVHRSLDEGFYVVAGQARFWCDGEVTEAGPGGFVFVRRGTSHRFEAATDHTVVIFTVTPPGLEGFFREGDELRANGLSDLEVRQRMSERYDSQLVT